jgi:type I restriction enzyme R subunit
LKNLFKKICHIEDTDTISEEFEKFWNIEQEKALKELIESENLEKKQKG